jgi:hypothetical protein
MTRHIRKARFTLTRLSVIRLHRSFRSDAAPSARKVAGFYARLDRIESLRATLVA